MSTSLISVSQVSKKFNNNIVLDQVSFDVEAQQTTVIVGTSGSGKTTLLRCCNGLEWPEQGRIEIAGKYLFQDGVRIEASELRVLRTQVAMIFQSFHLFPHLTVLENVMLGPLRLLKESRSSSYENALNQLTKVGMESKRVSFPSQLSGGQKQRVAIARALAMEPKIILIDEPTSALDPGWTHEIGQVIKRLNRDGATLLISTHEMGFANEVADQCILLDQGKVKDRGPPSEVLSKIQWKS